MEGGHIDLTWSAPGDNGSPITSYDLERKAGADDYATLTAPDPNALSYRDEDVAEGIVYTYRLRASNVDGDADWSNEAEGKRRTTSAAYPHPRGLAAEVVVVVAAAEAPTVPPKLRDPRASNTRSTAPNL